MAINQCNTDFLMYGNTSGYSIDMADKITRDKTVVQDIKKTGSSTKGR